MPGPGIDRRNSGDDSRLRGECGRSVSAGRERRGERGDGAAGPVLGRPLWTGGGSVWAWMVAGDACGEFDARGDRAAKRGYLRRCLEEGCVGELGAAGHFDEDVAAL